MENGDIFEFESRAHNSSLIAELANLRDDCCLCDVTLMAEGVRVNAHRVVLAAYSDYFKKMFTIDMLEMRQREIEVFDVEGATLEAIVTFCYSGKIQISDSNIANVLHAACLFQLGEVQEACCEFLKKQLHPSNCLGIRALADKHSCPELVRCADAYISRNFQDILCTEEFCQLPVSQLVYLISSIERGVSSEEQVFFAVLKWVEFDLSSRKQLLSKLMEHVRLSLCRPEFLVNTVSENKLVMEDAACHKLVDKAKNDLILQLSALEGPVAKRKRTGACDVGAGVIYVVGGIIDRSVESLDPDSDNPVWQYVAPLNKVRYDFGVAVIDRIIYAVCGRTDKGRLNSIERYHPAVDKWFFDAAPSPLRRSSLDVAALDGSLYALGGFIGDDIHSVDIVKCYDVRRDQWTSVASMGFKRAGLSVSVLDGCLYAIGGSSGSQFSPDDRPSNKVERLDPRIGRWEGVSSMITPRFDHGSAVLHGQLYAAGGHNNAIPILNSVEKYDPRANRWISVADMSRNRYFVRLVAVNGKLYAIGGDTVEKYDPETNQWEDHSNMNSVRCRCSVGVVPNT
uniref:BTB domain-containing protein n=1 Tax=Haemonchus contortus TaxID=6289 RepID=A0A7I4Z0U0_HAECO